eukprot:4377504-Pyramimonas_sp.AAC.1
MEESGGHVQCQEGQEQMVCSRLPRPRHRAADHLLTNAPVRVDDDLCGSSVILRHGSGHR